MAVKVLVVDDQKLIREGLALMLHGAEPEIILAGMAANGNEAVKFLAGTPVDVVLMDLRMPEMDGITATRTIIEQYPGTRVIALTTFDEDELIFGVLKAGAAGYLLKDIGKEEIITAIRQAMDGSAPISPKVAAKVIQRVARENEITKPQATSKENDGIPGTPKYTQPPLTDRALKNLSQQDWEILRLTAAGLSNTEIAHRLYVSRGTIKNHLSRIYERLGVSGRAEAAALFARKGSSESRDDS
ncbi:MAG TPA: response regulator transcription factor [Bacillota bacterium]